MARIGRILGTFAVGAVMVAALSGTAYAGSGGTSNAYGSAIFNGDGDQLRTCDFYQDGVLVRASVQKWYEAVHAWQAVGTNDAPPHDCDMKVIDVEPDTSSVRVHIWGEANGTKISGSDFYSESFSATP